MIPEGLLDGFVGGFGLGTIENRHNFASSLLSARIGLCLSWQDCAMVAVGSSRGLAVSD
jgi:hypothetical protein